jgi:hypothetical protein
MLNTEIPTYNDIRKRRRRHLGSKSGQTIPVVGYSSESVNRVLVVILLPANLPEVDGVWYGVNAWTANSTTIRRYQREGETHE